MELEYEYSAETEIPDAAKPFYKEVDVGGGKKAWRLNAKGIVAKSTHDEFRQTNTDLMKERDDLLDEVKPFREAGVDVEKYKKLIKIEKQLDEKQLVKLEKFDEAVEERTTTMRTEFETKVRDRDDTIARQNGELALVKIDQEVVKFLTKHNVESWAIEDLVRRAREKFKLEDGKVVAYKDDGKGGKEKDYGSTKGGMVTIEEWADDLPTSSPGYFKKSQGSGAPPDKGGDTSVLGGKPNPWKDPVNLTLQGIVTKKDPALAKRLRAEAGK